MSDYINYGLAALFMLNLLMAIVKRPEKADWTYYGFWALVLLIVGKP